MRMLSASEIDQANHYLEASEHDPQGPKTMAVALGWALRGARHEFETEKTNFNDYFISQCAACQRLALWQGDTMVWPAAKVGRPPSEDMPPDVATLYEEARDVAQRSPRAAATLLRVALERLVNQLVPGADNLNAKIGELVRQGLSSRVQKAMDAARIFGNEGAHPGELDLSDSARTVETLFDIINIVVQQVVSDEKVINELYNRIPLQKQDAIDRRNARQESAH